MGDGRLPRSGLLGRAEVTGALRAIEAATRCTCGADDPPVDDDDRCAYRPDYELLESVLTGAPPTGVDHDRELEALVNLYEMTECHCADAARGAVHAPCCVRALREDVHVLRRAVAEGIADGHPRSGARPPAVDVDALAQEIRRVDGAHSLGAGRLAEALAPYIAALLRARGVAA